MIILRYYKRQDVDVVFVGSQQLYATTFGRRHYVNDERERFGRREYGRKSERGIHYRAGRAFYKTPFRNAFHYRIALSNDNKRLSDVLKCHQTTGRFLYTVRKGIENK